MTSGMPFPSNLTAIDKLTRQDHSYLAPEDSCFFLGEYTARKGYAYSDTNNLIINLKKDASRRGKPEWRYKEMAIAASSDALTRAINDRWLEEATFVPIPPSKAKDDPMFDDRMTQVLSGINRPNPVDCRELIFQQRSTDAVHETDQRMAPDEIYTLYEINEDSRLPKPSRIVLCDDVLTTGAHFKAAQRILSEAYPDVPIVGCFIARRVPEAIDVEDFF